MIPGFIAQSTVYDNTIVIVPAIRNITIRPSIPSVKRECASFCVDMWITCLDDCSRGEGYNPYPGGNCYAGCDLIWNWCIDSCV